MALTKEKLNDMWHAGYCRVAVEFARSTDDTPAGARRRLQFLTQHINEGGCTDCGFANRLKGLESVVAQRMGPDAYRLFLNGGDITRLPDYQPELAAVLDGAIAAGIIPPPMRDWMERAAERKDYEP